MSRNDLYMRNVIAEKKDGRWLGLLARHRDAQTLLWVYEMVVIVLAHI
jgi:hypothetical protein